MVPPLVGHDKRFSTGSGFQDEFGDQLFLSIYAKTRFDNLGQSMIVW